MTRLSLATSRLCATRGAVMATIFLILGLLIGATAVLWNETAQLLVNSVTVSRAARGGRGRCSRGSAVTHHTNCAASSRVSSSAAARGELQLLPFVALIEHWGSRWCAMTRQGAQADDTAARRGL